MSASQTSSINVANGTSCMPTQRVISQCVRVLVSKLGESTGPYITLKKSWHQPTETQQNNDGLELVKTLKQVVAMPKV